ncbi:unnamed protein product [Mycetohabitans rhizoxinica HKI 454]|uniref:Uncharacterized protein n=1 Tax=Mycetohabitans rhizoxinica (strain DSM 19002 / CIP 109453 / HKI 454) TaxID=882378 RepID=E5AMX4_MYCRK|nr:unnamed protein product [Mycetohabitans rhizoxinica HKI 454]
MKLARGIAARVPATRRSYASDAPSQPMSVHSTIRWPATHTAIDVVRQSCASLIDRYTAACTPPCAA